MIPDFVHADSASLIHPLGSILERMDVSRVFSQEQPLEIELGSGDGSFLTQYAVLRPERNFIGVERLLGRLRKLDRKGARMGLRNVGAIRVEAAYFLEFLLPPASAEALHIYFPDPWPKRKHRRHRLINPRFPQLARAALVTGGTVYLRTDDAEYFAQMKSIFRACPFFGEIPTPPSLAAVRTDFERNFLKQGIPTLSAGYQLLTRR